jgi:peptidoglycan-associated lipoprotein
MRILSSYVVAALVISTAACTHTGKQTASDARSAPAGIVNPTSASRPGSLSLSDDLRRACRIEDTGAAPRFEFDSTILGPTDRSELDQLAKCMTAGPLAGKSVELVGRADPRGEAEYNMTLGARRADAVEHYLAQLGVSSSRLVTTSRGALDAQGRDETTWAVDRRVDLRLSGR